MRRSPMHERRAGEAFGRTVSASSRREDGACARRHCCSISGRSSEKRLGRRDLRGVGTAGAPAPSCAGVCGCRRAMLALSPARFRGRKLCKHGAREHGALR